MPIQRVVVEGEDLTVRMSREWLSRPSVADFSHCLAEEFATLSKRADSTANDTIVVDVDLLRLGLVQGLPDSSREVDMAMRFRLGLREEETTISLQCHARRDFEVEDTARREEVAQMDLAIGEAYRSCLEEIYLQFPPTRFLRRQTSPAASSRVETPVGAPPSGSGGQDMRHRWEFVFGGIAPGTVGAEGNLHFGYAYSYEPDSRKWTLEGGSSMAVATTKSWDISLLLAYGPKSEPSRFGRFLQGVAGMHFVNIARTGKEISVFSDRIAHVDSRAGFIRVFPMLGLRSGFDWDWDREGEFGWGLEVSTTLTQLLGPIDGNDPWEERLPGDVPTMRIDLKVALCMIL